MTQVLHRRLGGTHVTMERALSWIHRLWRSVALVSAHTLRAQIEGKQFTLFYDYDQLQGGKLSQLSDDGKIEWFRLRMDCVFLEPLRRLFDIRSKAFRELNSDTEQPYTYFGIAAFSLLLNGVEALGSFLPVAKSGKG